MAIRQRFLHLSDCTKLLGFADGNAALAYFKNVSYNYEPNVNLPTIVHQVGSRDYAFGYEGKVYLSQSGAALNGNALDHLLIHEMWHLLAPDKKDYIDSAEGKRNLGRDCQTGQNQ